MNHLRNIFLFILLGLPCLITAQEYRSIDGRSNNISNPEWGATNTPLARLTTVDYTDGISSPAGQDRLNPREVSNILFEQQDRIDDKLALSDFVWVFGQFIDHDITLVENFSFDENPEEALIIVPPVGDPFYGPGDFIPMMRSLESPDSGTDIDNPRQHDNAITSFIDASNIYGSDESRALWLRSFQDGKLRTSSGDMLPWNTIDGEFNSPIDQDVPFMETSGLTTKFYVAGDTRANENPLLISMHTIFVREHNLVCDEIIAQDSNLSDEEIYQEARKIVNGKLQAIVYNEWLPSMNLSIPEYSGYVDQINPAISNVFSAAAFRIGHTLINSNIIRMKNDGELIAAGNISLRDAFFNPIAVNLAGGVDPFIKGMGTQIQQDFDCKVVNDVRNFLFGIPGAGGLDLAAININRGRERGLPDYNTVRADFGLPRISEFSDLCSIPEIGNLLEEIYGSTDNIDPWVGMLAEDHLPNSLFGELVMKILESQFRVLRDGDRFYFENDNNLSEEWKGIVRNSTLNSIVMRNSSIDLMQNNLFVAMDHDDIPTGPEVAYENLNMAVYPNPIVDHFYLKVFSEEASEANLRVYDMSGQIVKELNFELNEGINNELIYLDENLETGIYQIYVESGSNYSISRLVKI